MNRLFARAATVALALPFATGVLASNASALEPIGTTVPGCYGAGPSWAIVCDVTVTVETPEPEFVTQTVKVCVGACYDVPVTTVRTEPGSRTRVCYTYKDGAGYSYGNCYDATGYAIQIDLLRYLDVELTDSLFQECVCPAEEQPLV